MSNTDKLGRNTARSANAWIVNGVPVAAKIRNALLPTAAEAIAEQLAPEQIDRPEAGLRAMSYFKAREAEAKRARAIETARQLKARDAARAAAREARPATRVQMVTDNRRYVASQGRLPHVGAHTAGKHTANLDAGMVNAPLHVIAKARAAAQGIA